jgi:hypothetical protein
LLDLLDRPGHLPVVLQRGCLSQSLSEKSSWVV